jgi:uncharacterized protein YajQ (UPF0234 family)
MPSFDIVSEINWQEVDNATNQAIKEVQSRYDFKGSHAEFQWKQPDLTIIADDEYKLGAMKDILQSKMHRRGIDIKAIQFEDPEPAGGRLLRQKVLIIQGIEREVAQRICKLIRDSKLKVQAQIMDEKIRVTSKSIDELQAAIQAVKNENFGVPLQYCNMRQ